MLLKGSGLGRVRVRVRGGVGVPDDDTDCESRGRPFFSIDLNLRRLAREELACYGRARG